MKFEKTRVFNFKSALLGMRNPMNSWDKSDSLFYTEQDDWIYNDYQLEDWFYQRFKENYLGSEEDFYDDYEEAKENMYNKYVFNWPDLEECSEVIAIGPNDMKLARSLIEGGSEHRKFLRQIFVTVDITAPFYIWKEFDTYKVGTVANSCSTMHKLAITPITLECFETDDIDFIQYKQNFQRQDLKHPIDQDFIQMCLIPYLEYLRRMYLKTQDKKYWKELIRWLPESWLQKRTITLNYENLRNIYHQRKNHKLTEWHSLCKWIETLPYAKEFIIN